MKSRMMLAVLVLLLAAVSQASAHFVWVAIDKDSAGAPALFVWFSELAEADSAELLDKIATIKVWTRSAKENSQPLKVTKKVEGNGGALVASIPAGAKAASAHINYGVLDRKGDKFLLQYHAKYLDVSSADWKALARDEALKLEIVPEAADKGFTLSVLFQGKPVAGSEVVIFDPTAAETKGTTDETGRIALPAAKPGLYSIRAKWVVKEAGKQADQEYPQVNHYSTLALRVPATAK
jgi:uncharacterized GH25 family protein